MAQSTQNLAKSTTPKEVSPVKKHYRKKRLKANIIAAIMVIAVLCVAVFFSYKILTGNFFKDIDLTVDGFSEIFSDTFNDVAGDDITDDSVQSSDENVVDPKPLEIITKEPEVSLTISVVGDCTLGTDEKFSYSRSLNAYYEKYGPDYFLQNVKNVFEADDLTIANLEGTFTSLTTRADKTYAFKGPAEFVNILTGSSVESVNLANNHSRDYGMQSLTDTKNVLDEAGVVHFGYDETAVVDVKGIKAGLVGIYELIDHKGREQQVKDNIAKVKAEGAQLVIVIFHWGIEREAAPNSHQTYLGRLAIDEGADLVCGHHPHVLQGIETYKGKNIVYSLGNFCFGGNSNPSDKDTMIFQQTFTITSDGVKADNVTNIIPCSLSSETNRNNYQPTPATGDVAERILKKIEERSALIPKP